MVDPADVSAVWADAADLTARFYAAADGRFSGTGWFASLSRQPSAELNVCGLHSATDSAAAELVAVLGPALPALVFTSRAVGDASREVLRAADFDETPVPEPVMRSVVRPVPVEGPFTLRRCEGADDLDVALDLVAAAHQVPKDLLASSIGRTAASGAASVWLALDGLTPVSTVWLTQVGSCVGVMEMMTPPEYQGHGAGRCLLSSALHEEWGRAITHSVLLGTPAGRRLYESLGFAVVDESLTHARGLDDAVLVAIGQA